MTVILQRVLPLKHFICRTVDDMKCNSVPQHCYGSTFLYHTHRPMARLIFMKFHPGPVKRSLCNEVYGMRHSHEGQNFI